MIIADRARQQRVVIALAQIAGLSCWFSASAVAPSMQAHLHIGTTGAILLTSSVQLGFVMGAVSSAVLNLADRIDPPTLYGASAMFAATCTALLTVIAHGFASAALLRVATGMALAGVYPVGMKLTASWAAPAERGRALGLLVGALTLGSAVPQIFRGVFGPLLAGCAAVRSRAHRRRWRGGGAVGPPRA